MREIIISLLALVFAISSILSIYKIFETGEWTPVNLAIISLYCFAFGAVLGDRRQKR
jgi:thiamine transporter ThiT